MNHCETCENALFDELWGEYKCKIPEVYIYGGREHECPDHKEGTPTVSKGIETN